MNKLKAISVISIIIASSLLFALPQVSSIGCLPAEFFRFQGPFVTSGFSEVGEVRWSDDVYLDIFVMTPGSSANISYVYFYWDTFFTSNATIKPIIGMVEPNPEIHNTPAWLNISASPEQVTIPPEGRANITVTMSASVDAPPGEYLMDTYGELQSTKCGYASQLFVLKIDPLPTQTVTVTEPRTAVTTTVQATTTTTVFITTTVENTSATPKDSEPAGEDLMDDIVEILQSSSIGIGIAIAGISAALVISRWKRPVQ